MVETVHGFIYGLFTGLGRFIVSFSLNCNGTVLYIMGMFYNFTHSSYFVFMTGMANLYI